MLIKNVSDDLYIKDHYQNSIDFKSKINNYSFFISTEKNNRMNVSAIVSGNEFEVAIDQTNNYFSKTKDYWTNPVKGRNKYYDMLYHDQRKIFQKTNSTN